MIDALDNELHKMARAVAETLRSPDRKQLRFNEIVEAAKTFYPNAVEDGITELVCACDREASARSEEFIGPMPPNPLYLRGRPMWKVLQEEYLWMTEGDL